MKPLNSSLSHLIRILNDSQYHDGTNLGKTLHITRSAVWKIIKKLEEYNIPIDSIKGKGYALLEPLILLDEKEIKSSLSSQKIKIEIFESMESTNDYLKKFCNDKTPRIVLAEQQTMGRGRLNREWYSPFGQNIYFSCLYPMQKDVSELAGLSLVVSLALTRALNTYHFAKPLLIKWPNDIIYDQKKLAGTLIEVQAETHDISYPIIGIGLNVNMLKNKHHPVSQPWTSLRNMSGEYINRNILIANLINHLWETLYLFEKQGLAPFLQEWKMLDYLYDRQIILKSMNTKIAGKAKGINASGHLLVKLKDDTVKAFSSGDTTISQA